MTPAQALAFVARHGLVLMAAKGPVPSLAEAVAGEPVRGSWWGHPRGRAIFAAAEAVRGSADVLACKLVAGKVTFAHRRLWPALVRLADRLPAGGLDATWSEHTPSGAHAARRTPFPEWVPADVARAAERLSVAEAERELAPWPFLLGGPAQEAPEVPRAPGGKPRKKGR